MKAKELLVIRAISPESDERVITIGNHLAIAKKFKNEAAAKMIINKIDSDICDIMLSLAFAACEAWEKDKENKNNNK